MKRNLKLFSLLFIIVCIMSGCSSANYIVRQPVPNEEDTRGLFRETARAYLIGTQKEKAGYGLYSYLLFSTPPTDDYDRKRYLKAITNYVNMIPTARDSETYIPKNELNIIYLPLEIPPSTNHPSAEWLLDNYNYPRARILINAVQRDLRDGPYIISVLKPLNSQNNENSHYIYFDLSHVPPQIISLWVKEFMRQASKERHWEENTTRKFILNIRTKLEVLADGTEEVRNALTSNNVISLKEIK